MTKAEIIAEIVKKTGIEKLSRAETHHHNTKGENPRAKKWTVVVQSCIIYYIVVDRS